jgi:hypothetical protein
VTDHPRKESSNKFRRINAMGRTERRKIRTGNRYGWFGLTLRQPNRKSELTFRMAQDLPVLSLYSRTVVRLTQSTRLSPRFLSKGNLGGVKWTSQRDFSC